MSFTQISHIMTRQVTFTFLEKQADDITRNVIIGILEYFAVLFSVKSSVSLSLLSFNLARSLKESF